MLDGLQQHLKAPDLLKEFAKAYQEERDKLSAGRRRERDKLGSQLAEIERTIERMWADYAAERVPVEIAGPKLKELQAQKVALQTELSDCFVEKRTVALHPAALRRYQEHVAPLHTVFAQGVTSENKEAAAAIRDLVARVTIHPRTDGHAIEVHGRLALLMDAPGLYPNMRIAASGGTVVAEEGFEPPTHGL